MVRITLGDLIFLPFAVLALASCQAQLVIPNIGQASLGVVSAGNATTFGATTPVPLYFATSTFALSNQSLKGATQVSLSFSDNSVIFEGGSYPGTGGTCGTSLGPNSTCTITAYSQLIAGTTAKLILSYFDGATLQTLTVPLATKSLLDATQIQKFTIAAPLLRTGAAVAAANDINRFLISIAGSGWLANTFQAPDQSVYFTSPCKPFDPGGWKLCLAHWDASSITAGWLDSNTGTADLDPFVSNTNTMNAWLTFGASNQVTGVSWNGAGFKAHKMTATDPLSINNASTAGVDNFFYTPPGGVNWNSNLTQGLGGKVRYDDSKYYIYQMTNDGTSQYMSVFTSSDFTTFLAPSNYISKNFYYPYVVRYQNYYLMIAYDSVKSQWVCAPGRSPTEFNFSNPTPLPLNNFVGAGADWDTDLFSSLSGGNPILAGVEVVGDYLYFFYMAGSFDYTAATAPYGGPRGIGALRVRLTAP